MVAEISLGEGFAKSYLLSLQGWLGKYSFLLLKSRGRRFSTRNLICVLCGQGNSWLVSDDHMEILSGNSSLLAALTTGMQRWPCCSLSLSSTPEHEYREYLPQTRCGTHKGKLSQTLRLKLLLGSIFLFFISCFLAYLFFPDRPTLCNVRMIASHPLGKSFSMEQMSM